MFRRIQKYPEALRQFSKVQKKLPQDKSIYYERGIVYALMGNHELAIVDFNKALDLDPKF